MAMALRFDKLQPVTMPPIEQYPVHIKCLKDDIDIGVWIATGSEAFGYSIDENVIVPLLACGDVELLLAYNADSEPVATGLLLKTDGIVGIHQIGVPADHQGKGYATQMMRFLIQLAEKWQADYVVLQASEAGRAVYQRLGFVDQFLITYLQRNKI